MSASPDLAWPAAAFGLGLLLWPLLEYAVHGWLAHTFRTFVSPLHGAHHTAPERVFTSPLAWVPVSLLIWLGATSLLGAPVGSALTAGVVAGFLRYEYLHWRIHFRAPRTPREARRRSHHLAHHFCNARAYYGVSTDLWDRVFRTLPAERERHFERVRDVPPLRGASNLGTLVPPRR
jgi:sterol desaturase/sphingolipid hydroxylase (fatty acid hydroxylase superfamily)